MVILSFTYQIIELEFSVGTFFWLIIESIIKIYFEFLFFLFILHNNY